MRYRSAAQTPRRRVMPRCSGCGLLATNPLTRAEIAMLWLLPGAGNGAAPMERRFCRACAPAGPVDELVCVRCGDGPLLVGALAAADEVATVVMQAWMSAAGWRVCGPVCPGRVGELAR